MTNNKVDDGLKVFDDLFDELQRESNETSEEFNEKMKSKLQDMAVSNGYNSYEEMIKTPNDGKPKLPLIEDADNRVAFMRIAFDTISYEGVTDEEYIAGHKEAIQKYKAMVDESTNDLDALEDTLDKEIDSLNIEDTENNPKALGYWEGLKMVDDIIDQSKQMMMKKLNAELSSGLTDK